MVYTHIHTHTVVGESDAYNIGCPLKYYITDITVAEKHMIFLHKYIQMKVWSKRKKNVENMM